MVPCAQMEVEIRSFEDCESFLDGRDSRKLGHNTYVERRSDMGGHPCFTIRHHRTDVITYFAEGRVMLDTNGHMTPTTKWRLNKCSPFSVYSEGDGEWAVYSPNKRDGARFVDRMTSDRNLGWQEHKSSVYKRGKGRIRAERRRDRGRVAMERIRISQLRERDRKALRTPEEVDMF